MKGLLDLLESDMEDVENHFDYLSASEESAIATAKQKTAQAKKPRKRKPVTMPKTRSRVTKAQPEGSSKQTTKATDKARRNALEEQVNGQKAKADFFSGSEDELESPQTLHQKPEAEPRPQRTHRATEEPEEMEIDQTPLLARSSHARTKATKAAPKVMKKAAAANAKPTKPLSAKAGERMQEQEYGSEEDVHVVSEPLQRSRQTSVVRTTSRRPQDAVYRRRHGSASDTERGDPNLRRKLGNITLKFENIDLKYRNLKEVGVHEATANAEKMRKQCEATSQKSAELISSLKAELAMKAPLAQDAHNILTDLQSKDKEMSKLQYTVTDLTRSLADAQNEIKALQAKLSASRSISVERINTKTPGSIAKHDTVPRTIVAGSAEAIHAAQAAQMKEDIYSDLTGLIIRSAKKTPEGDAYDCIQTGRNGTLHFRLYVDQEDAKNMSFEETEFLYTPLLDTNRDREMIELMPDYLRDEITFARQNAAKFYSRVVDTLTKRRVDE